MNDEKKYYIGLDCGTNSVGWAVTDEDYHLLRRRGKTLWGMRLFDEAKTAAERRGFRSSRRRMARAKRRIKLLQMLFSKEIAKVDPDFYIRLRESLYLEEDKRGFSNVGAVSKYTLFNDLNFSDVDYHKQFPTIWHLRQAIIDATNDESKHFDIRLYYLAIEHIIKHRGHFLRSGEINSGAGDFSELWNSLCDTASVCGITVDKSVANEAEALLRQGMSKSDKKKQLEKMMFTDALDNSDYDGNYKVLAHLLCGSSVHLNKLFNIEADEDVKLEFSKDNFDEKYPVISDFVSSVDGAEDLILAAKAIYDYVYLCDLLKDSNNISAAMVRNYDIHHRDLADIKQALKPFKDDCKHFFQTEVAENESDVFYNAYISKGSTKKNKSYSVNQEDINKELKRLFEKNGIGGELLSRATEGTLLPKQRGYAKGTIPQQLHHNELRLILQKLCQDYPSFAVEAPGESGKYNTKAKKIESIHSFRIPYYCGPLLSKTQKSEKFAWGDEINETVYPWNYDELVDKGELANRFINRMTNECTYIVGTETLPKNSLAYQKYMVLNELNNLKINGSRIDNEIKQRIYNQAYLGGELGGNVTLKKLSQWMKSVGILGDADELSGSAETKILPKLSTYADFYRILGADYNKQYPVGKLEKVVNLITILNNEPTMLAEKIQQELDCSNEQARRLAQLNYKDWGKFSLDFLSGIRTDINGRQMTILEALWETPNNLMELLSGEFGFRDELDRANSGKVSNTGEEIAYEQVQELYCSPAVKRTVWQAIKIVNEIRKVMGRDPAKVFIEVTRGDEKGKPKVKLARRKELLDKYKAIRNGKDEFANKLFEQLNSHDDRDLQSKKLFLYYQQMGKCAYTGERIELDEINNTRLYDIDHIYPRSRTKDDSITRNLVLVKAEANREKTNKYPINPDIQAKMRGQWSYWYSKGLITKEKYERLTRTTPLTPDELAGFIQRQIVETGQSTKAIGELLQRGLPNTKVVTVKAGGVSDLRHYYGYNSDPVRPEFIKIRELNDLHHAKDAYLNIVVGNVINSTFTDNPRNWIKDQQGSGYNYSIRTNLIFRDSEIYTKKDGTTTKYPVVKAWHYADSLEIVASTMRRNDVLWTRMNHKLSTKGGGLMDAQLMRKAPGYIPRKKNARLQDTSKYGGYNSPMGAYFALIEESNGARKIISIPLLEASDANGYIRRKYDGAKVIIPRIDFMSKMIVNGFPVHLTGRSGDGRIMYYPARQLFLSVSEYSYLKKVCSVIAKLQTDKKYMVSDKDGVSTEKNNELFNSIANRLVGYMSMPGFEVKARDIEASRTDFSGLNVVDQCKAIVALLNILGCNANKGDLSSFVPRAQIVGSCYSTNDLSNLNTVKLIYQSVTGLYEKIIDLKTVQPGGV